LVGNHHPRLASPLDDGRQLTATRPNQVWSYDFEFDHCVNGQQLKCLTVTDEFTKEELAIDVDGRIRSLRGRSSLTVDRKIISGVRFRIQLKAQ